MSFILYIVKRHLEVAVIADNEAMISTSSGMVFIPLAGRLLERIEGTKVVLIARSRSYKATFCIGLDLTHAMNSGAAFTEF